MGVSQCEMGHQLSLFTPYAGADQLGILSLDICSLLAVRASERPTLQIMLKFEADNGMTELLSNLFYVHAWNTAWLD